MSLIVRHGYSHHIYGIGPSNMESRLEAMARMASHFASEHTLVFHSSIEQHEGDLLPEGQSLEHKILSFLQWFTQVEYKHPVTLRLDEDITDSVYGFPPERRRYLALTHSEGSVKEYWDIKGDAQGRKLAFTRIAKTLVAHSMMYSQTLRIRVAAPFPAWGQEDAVICELISLASQMTVCI